MRKFARETLQLPNEENLTRLFKLIVFKYNH